MADVRPASARFLEAITRSHRMATTVEVLAPGVDPALVGSVVAGAVTLDQTAASRGRADVTFADDGLVPTTAESSLAPYGNELRVSRGVIYPDATADLVSLGIFRIDDVNVNADGTVQVTGLDRSARVIDAKFEEPYQIASATNYATAIHDTIAAGVPGLSYDFVVTTRTTPQLVANEGDDRWAFCQEMAKSLGMSLYFDGDGVCVLKPVAALGGQPVWELVEGESGLLLDVGRTWTRQGVSNRVIAVGQNTGDAAPSRGVATDLNSNSPTYYLGTFGRVPLFYASPLITTDAQALDAASAVLARQLGATQTVSFGAIVNPALEPDDIVAITRLRSGVNESNVIDSLSIPLSADGVMTGATRAITLFGSISNAPAGGGGGGGGGGTPGPVVLTGPIHGNSTVVGNFAAPPSSALYVSPTGNDAATGLSVAPLRTIAHACAMSAPGGLVYVQGTFTQEKVTITSSGGTTGAPLTIKQWPGAATAVIDGNANPRAGTNLWFASDFLVYISTSNIIWDGIEIKNSPWYGFVASGSNVTLRNTSVHDVYAGGVVVSGSNHTLQDVEVYYTCLQNLNAPGGGWPAGIETNVTAGGRADNMSFIRVHTHDNWGEGLIFLHAKNSRALDCISNDNFSVNFYVDNANDILIDGCKAYNTAGNPITAVRPGYGFLFGNEAYGYAHDASATRNITLTNNFFYNTNPIAYYGGPGYSGIKLIGNTIRNVQLEIGGTGTGCEFIDNIASCPTFSIINPAGWIIDHNDWPLGSTQGTNAVTHAATFASSTVSSDDALRLANNLLLATGANHAALTTDFFGNTRPSLPTIGAHELGAI